MRDAYIAQSDERAEALPEGTPWGRLVAKMKAINEENIRNLAENLKNKGQGDFMKSRTTIEAPDSAKEGGMQTQGGGPKQFIKVAEGEDGYTFGELALLSNRPRFATVQCTTDCHMASLDRRSFATIKQLHQKIMINKIAAIRKFPHFSTLSRSALNRYQHFFEERTFVRG